MNQPPAKLPPSSQPFGKYFLLTGATGLVGRYLLRDMLVRGAKVAVLARANKRLTARQRVENILQMWERQLERSLPRPVIFEGDVALPNLGLDENEVAWVRENCDTVIHNAAILQFEGECRTEEPWRTNLNGTQHVLELTRAADITNLHYVSTAYVCGQRDEVVMEDDLDCGQSFRNVYEQSKFEAEKAVRAATHLTNVTIFRPAVIAGDSLTGYTSTYHGIYLYLRLLATIIPMQEQDEDGVYQTKIQLPMTGDEPRNVIPVDWVSAVMTHVIFSPEAHNATIHMVPDSFTTPKKLIDACYGYFNSGGVEYCGPNIQREAISEFSKMFFDAVKIYEKYETDDPIFDQSNLKKFAGHLPCPEISAELIVRFIEFGKSDKWGKRREKAPDVEFDFSASICELVTEANRLSASGGWDGKIGLNVLGPGGGQWTLLHGDRGFESKVGLDSDANVITFDEKQVEQALMSCDHQDSKWDFAFAQLFGATKLG